MSQFCITQHCDGLEPHPVQFQSLIYAGWLRFHELILAQIFAKLNGLKAATLQLVPSSESSC